MARVQHLLLCMSVAVSLVAPCFCAARSLHTTGTRGLLTSTISSEDGLEVPRNGNAQGVPTSAMERENEFHKWARFQEQEVSVDYEPVGANPNPGIPSPIGE